MVDHIVLYITVVRDPSFIGSFTNDSISLLFYEVSLIKIPPAMR